MKNISYLYLALTPLFINAQFGPEQIITTENPSTWSLFLTDLDGDNKLDLLATEEVDSKVIWYKNLDGLGTFGAQNIITLNLEYTRYVTAADIDGDGDMDVLATSGSSDLVVWYENTDGLGTFGYQQIISDNLLLPLMVRAADIDGDGDLDVIIPSKADNKITWLENTDGQGTFGPQQIISNTTQIAAAVFLADMDGDGDMDVVSDRSINGFPCWYENLDGLGNFGPQQEITQNTTGSFYIIADDLDNDGDMDVIGMEFGGNTIAWYENTDGLGNFGSKQIITTDIYAPRLFVTADFDNDGDQDIVYNSQASLVEKVAWQANDGHGNFGPQQLIYNDTSENVIALRGLFAADVDNDGDMDVFSSAIGFEDKISWFENLTILGVEENLQQKISLHPNPANNIIKITNTSGFDIKKIWVYNVMGKLVKEINQNTNQINSTNWASGMYFVTLKTEQGSLTKKVVKE